MLFERSGRLAVRTSQGLGDPLGKIRTAVGMAISTIAQSDWPDAWPELTGTLLGIIRERSSADLGASSPEKLSSAPSRAQRNSARLGAAPAYARCVPLLLARCPLRLGARTCCTLLAALLRGSDRKSCMRLLCAQ